ncbi:MAG TPA: hypothetical protein VMM15_20530 [Bradyrhizobium sp.]|nr:hypothetical protein [Bradyrhizobium sp.]
MTTRRRFLGSVGSAIATAPLAPFSSAADEAAWNAGDLAHVIPTASHERLLIKTSFLAPVQTTPQLMVGDHATPGLRSDTGGRFWQFDVAGLAPGTTYSLQIRDAAGRVLCDPWPMRTLPAPDAPATRLRILAFTCGGGYDLLKLGDKTLFLDMAARRRLLAKALSFQPDIIISNGDMIYWDIMTALNKGKALGDLARAAWAKVGMLDFDSPMFGTENEAILQRIADYQIASLYGTSLRSIPSFFLTDDHDLFENDEGTPQFVTLPPTHGRVDAERAVQHMYYPEFLPDANRPAALEGSSAADRRPGLSEGFGTLRFGKLIEAVFYDTKRYVSLDGDRAGMVPPSVEAWLLKRTAAEDTTHFIHAPSTPFGWSAGKFGEWYPDIARKDGTLITGIHTPKPYWPTGWWLQHQRLVSAIAAQQRRVPVVLQGDLHVVGYGIMHRSGTLDLGANPIHMALTGPLGTGDVGFPSAYRGTKAQPSSLLDVEQSLAPLEKNGFTIVDISSDRIVLRLFAWRPPESVESIDLLEPSSYEISR